MNLCFQISVSFPQLFSQYQELRSFRRSEIIWKLKHFAEKFLFFVTKLNITSKVFRALRRWFGCNLLSSFTCSVKRQPSTASWFTVRLFPLCFFASILSVLMRSFSFYLFGSFHQLCFIVISFFYFFCISSVLFGFSVCLNATFFMLWKFGAEFNTCRHHFLDQIHFDIRKCMHR